MPFNRAQFLTAISGTLKAADWWRHDGARAMFLLAGIAAAESEFGTHKRQIASYKEDGKPIYGPARGVFQMEPRTLTSLYEHYFTRRPRLCNTICFLTGIASPDIYALEHNLMFQILVARAYWFQFSERLPEPVPDDLAEAWKRRWNTSAGAGTEQGFKKKWRKYMEQD